MSAATPARSSSSSAANASCETAWSSELGRLAGRDVHPLLRRAMLDDDRPGRLVLDGCRGHHGSGGLDRADRSGEVRQLERSGRRRVGRRSLRGRRLAGAHLAERGRHERRALLVDVIDLALGRLPACPRARPRPSRESACSLWVGTRSAASTSIDFVPKNPPTPPFLSSWRWLRITAWRAQLLADLRGELLERSADIGLEFHLGGSPWFRQLQRRGRRRRRPCRPSCSGRARGTRATATRGSACAISERRWRRGGGAEHDGPLAEAGDAVDLDMQRLDELLGTAGIESEVAAVRRLHDRLDHLALDRRVERDRSDRARRPGERRR